MNKLSSSFFRLRFSSVFPFSSGTERYAFVFTFFNLKQKYVKNLRDEERQEKIKSGMERHGKKSVAHSCETKQKAWGPEQRKKDGTKINHLKETERNLKAVKRVRKKIM